jgi:hypothetical protein
LIPQRKERPALRSQIGRCQRHFQLFLLHLSSCRNETEIQGKPWIQRNPIPSPADPPALIPLLHFGSLSYCSSRSVAFPPPSPCYFLLHALSAPNAAARIFVSCLICISPVLGEGICRPLHASSTQYVATPGISHKPSSQSKHLLTSSQASKDGK